MKQVLIRKKSLEQMVESTQNSSANGLRRTLGPFSLTMLGIGAIIGAGLFVLTGQAAAVYAGPGIIFSFLLAAFICVFAALCYAELASMIPVSGSVYSYVYVTLGELAAWIIGLVLILQYLFSPSTVAVGWSSYATSLLRDFDIVLPAYLSQAPVVYDVVHGWGLTGALINLPAVFIVLLVGSLVAIGVQAAARFNNLMVFVKMTAILLFLVCGVFYVNPDNWTPLIPENTGVFGEFGISGILRGAGVVFFAYIGFDALATLAQETRNPQKDLPVGMVASLGISTVVYIAMALVLTGVVSYQLLDVPDPIAVAVNNMGAKFTWLRYFVKVAILSGLSTVIMVMIMGHARILCMISQDGLLPAWFGKIHHKYQTPFNATIVIMLVMGMVVGIFPVGILGQLTSIGTLLLFVVVCLGGWYLRKTRPDLKRVFKVPFSPFIPIAGAAVCLGQMAVFPLVSWVQLIVWIGLGTLFYFGYGIKHSRLNQSK